MNLPTLIVLLIIAAALFLVLWLPRRGGKKQNRKSIPKGHVLILLLFRRFVNVGHAYLVELTSYGSVLRLHGIDACVVAAVHHLLPRP